MFGFGKSIEQFRAEVDVKLNNEYQIITDNSKNKYFPGIFAYADLIDFCKKKAGWNADETAMHIAINLYCGLLKIGLFEDAEKTFSQIERVVGFGLKKNLISQKVWGNHQKIIERERNKYPNNNILICECFKWVFEFNLAKKGVITYSTFSINNNQK